MSGKHVKIEWPLEKSLVELEKELRKYHVNRISIKLKPFKDPKLLVEVDTEEGEATIKAPKSIHRTPWYDIISWWAIRYEEKYENHKNEAR